MTIQMTFGTPTDTQSRIYRKVYIGKNYAEYVESFYALQETYQWGVMIKLKGKEIMKLHEFGSR